MQEKALVIVWQWCHQGDDVGSDSEEDAHQQALVQVDEEYEHVNTFREHVVWAEWRKIHHIIHLIKRRDHNAFGVARIPFELFKDCGELLETQIGLPDEENEVDDAPRGVEVHDDGVDSFDGGRCMVYGSEAVGRSSDAVDVLGDGLGGVMDRVVKLLLQLEVYGMYILFILHNMNLPNFGGRLPILAVELAEGPAGDRLVDGTMIVLPGGMW
ncbi:hypothetical protein B0H10DRAFT_1955490 [Mycena sp. CBHHK59/15]|nr:hypothetical protein B0H10DRAFT_1955490 [Mycena sp. CBHHK59/15]